MQTTAPIISLLIFLENYFKDSFTASCTTFPDCTFNPLNKCSFSSNVLSITEIGFKSLLPSSVQTPIIVTFISPSDKKFKFNRFYNRLKKKGFIIYPGKMAKRDSFRIGCIGYIGKKEMKMLTNEIAKFVKMEKICLN